MNADRLKVLMRVLKTGSLSAAAEELSFTPSGISRMMAALEEEFGFPLLLRGKEGVRATAELEQLMPVVRDYLFWDEKLREEADAIRGIAKGIIVIGCAYSGYYSWLEQAMTKFRSNYPGIQFQLRSGFSTELLEMLRGHEVDLCISTMRETDHEKKQEKGFGTISNSEEDRPDRDLEWIVLGRDEMIFQVPAKSHLAGEKSLPLSIVGRESYIDIFPGKDIDNNRILRENHIHPNTQYEAMDSYTAYSMVSAGLGIAMNSRLNSAYAGGDVCEIPIEPAQYLQIGLAYRKDSSPAAEKFIQSIR